MRECQECGSEMKERSIAYHLFTYTLKIGLGIGLVAGIFGKDSLVDFGISLIMVIPYLALVIYPFKLGMVYKCTNKDCKEVHFENTETFDCNHCEGDSNVKRKKVTTKITLVGLCLVFIGFIIPMDYELMNVTKVIFTIGLSLNVLAAVLEKLNVFRVILECKGCGHTVVVAKEKVKEYGL